MDNGINMGLLIAMIEQASGADPAVIEQAVQDWLEDHPEATTTVQDGSITLAKLASDVAAKINQVSQLSDEIDGIDSDVTDLKSAIDSSVKYVGLNLVGMDTSKLYPVYLPAGSSVTISTADGNPTATAIPLRF